MEWVRPFFGFAWGAIGWDRVYCEGMRDTAIRDVAGRASPTVPAWTPAFSDRNDLCQSGGGYQCAHSLASDRRGSRSQTRCRCRLDEALHARRRVELDYAVVEIVCNGRPGEQRLRCVAMANHLQMRESVANPVDRHRGLQERPDTLVRGKDCDRVKNDRWRTGKSHVGFEVLSRLRGDAANLWGDNDQLRALAFNCGAERIQGMAIHAIGHEYAELPAL